MKQNKKTIVLFGQSLTVPSWIPIPVWAEQFVQFAVIGVFNTLADLLILLFLSFLTGIKMGIGAGVLQAVSFSIVSFLSFLANKRWTFKEKTKGISKAVVKYVQFVVITLGGLAIKSGLVFVITTFISPLYIGIINFQINPTMWLAIASLGATAVSLIWNFVGYKFIVFKK